jgi:RNA 3'-phosphate cyclase
VETVEVDGSYGEGGGQILRTAATFSIATRKPIHVARIREGREVPGLRQQHASALEILRSVSGGTLEGCSVGSTEITFRPGRAGPESLFFDLKTAASITLVLQAVVPAVALSAKRLSLELVGGTDVPWSPTLDYFGLVVREAFSRIGIDFRLAASTRGYYPKGGGRVKVSVERRGTLRALSLLDPPARASASVVSRCGSLPEHVARRQLEAASSALGTAGISLARTESSVEGSSSPGSSLLVYELGDDRIVVSDELGARGKSSEMVGSKSARGFVRTVSSGATVDANLADMLAPILALAPRESRFRIPGPTRHLEPSLHVAQLFTGCGYDIGTDGASPGLTISPRNGR